MKSKTKKFKNAKERWEHFEPKFREAGLEPPGWLKPDPFDPFRGETKSII